jgi:hypothetical protein
MATKQGFFQIAGFPRVVGAVDCTHVSIQSPGGPTAELYSVETTYGINSVISKLMTFIENAETGQFLFLIVLILSCFTCS